jgi:hypothetical protein
VLNTGMIAPRDEQGRTQMRDLHKRSVLAAMGPTRESVHERLKGLMADPDKSIISELIDNRYRIYSQPGRPALMQKIMWLLTEQQQDAERAREFTDATVMRQLQCPVFVIWTSTIPAGCRNWPRKRQRKSPTMK